MAVSLPQHLGKNHRETLPFGEDSRTFPLPGGSRTEPSTPEPLFTRAPGRNASNRGITRESGFFFRRGGRAWPPEAAAGVERCVRRRGRSYLGLRQRSGRGGRSGRLSHGWRQGGLPPANPRLSPARRDTVCRAGAGARR